jgi:hypothetical protein
MDKKKDGQENADQAWERNRLLNEIQYLLNAGKMKEAKELKKQYRELVKKQKEKNKH